MGETAETVVHVSHLCWLTTRGHHPGGNEGEVKGEGEEKGSAGETERNPATAKAKFFKSSVFIFEACEKVAGEM